MAKANVLEAMHTKLKAKKDVCVFLRPTTPREPVTAAIRPVHIPQPAVDRDASRTINSEPKATKEIAKTNCNRPKIICTGNAEQQAVLLCGVYDFFFNDLDDFIELPSSLISSGGNLCFLLILESNVAALEAIVSSNCFLNSSCDINFGFFKSSSIGFDITTNVAAVNFKGNCGFSSYTGLEFSNLLNYLSEYVHLAAAFVTPLRAYSSISLLFKFEDTFFVVPALLDVARKYLTIMISKQYHLNRNLNVYV
uniref:Uncharacterized protein n=1 Tax=Glossina palpalis gambiensis TaxID=67801 RepID=A0A1B0C735_9MUSC